MYLHLFFEKTKKKQQLPTKYHKTIVTIKKYYVVTQVRKPLGVNLSHRMSDRHFI